MEWSTVFGPDRQPTEDDISQFVESPLWAEINSYMHANYDVQPSYSYSNCSAQPGWNLKYRKAGRSLCTLYPMPGYYIALVVIGSREMNEAELVMPLLSQYTQDLFKATAFSAGGKWLMISVADKQIFEDVKQLIQIRRKANQKV